MNLKEGTPRLALLIRKAAKLWLIMAAWIFPVASVPQSKGIPPSLLARAKAGDADSELRVGSIYTNGQGVPQDNRRAMYWFRKAAENGNVESMMILSRAYEYGMYGVSQEDSQAAIWYTKAAERGNPIAQTKLGDCFVSGRGLPQDFAQAAFWFRKAAEQADPNGQAALGSLYETGTGVPKNYVEAYFWMSIAASNPDSPTGSGSISEMRANHRDKIAAHLAGSELLSVQTRTRSWFAAHPPKTQ